MCISSQGKDIEQKDQVEKGNLRCTRPCMIEKNYFFLIMVGLGSFHSSLGSDLQLNNASFVRNDKYMHNFDTVFPSPDRKIAKGDYTAKPQKTHKTHD